ncbi:Pyrrolo-quinoline quinone [Haloterrigena turkmenica DSM 5511]|uniref:Pyrrolo-quinoline quinone n=1 Tax=Haloterrigena turkmenica (strain ATCC 51198 / DSM 5511 / JCM 9101 / NCIMB 13204 / VKM B-1734 / 4k) TaxID=543526 RepID=D2RVF0_HALTV|nr:PQQ-binding-like beta-propeller repeat protein [Haloterrigena turkmenica]ADB61351.1 Pyrrolo-quinoline quinone [Haloterrigena turkmenica DSM 5511]
MRSPNRDTVSERGPDRSADLSRRQLLGASAGAAAAGLAGCVGLPTTLGGRLDGSEDVSLFQNGLRRLGYYPDETVPESVSVNWSFPINAADHTAAKSSPVPTPDGETIVFAGDTGKVCAYAPSGDLQWATQTDATKKGFHGSAAIVGDTAFIGGYDGDLYAIDVESDDGEIVWRTRSEDGDLDGPLAIGSSPAYHDGSLYVVSEYAPPSSGAIWEVDPDTGDPTWSDDRVWGQAHPSPTIDLEAGRLLFGSNDGVVYCWEYPSLEFAWSFQADADGEEQEGGAFRKGAQIKGTTAAHDGYGYVGSWDGTFYCLDLEDGSEEWAFETGKVIMSNPAVDTDADVVYMGSDDDYVYALDAKSGEELWSTDVGGRVIGALTVTAETVLAGSYDSHLYALDKETGDQRWRVQNRGRVTSAAVPVDGRIYYAERAVFSNYYDDEETVLEEPGHGYCLVGDE